MRCTSANEAGYLLYTNRAEDRLFGYDRGELVGQHRAALTGYPPDESQRIFAEILNQVDRSGIWIGDLSTRKKDGTAFTTHARISVLVG
jgi:PAS domain S-box-containing protein